MFTYSLTSSANISRSDGSSIPPDPANTDYAQYLAWVAQGNTATPYTAPAPTPAQQAAAAIAAGVTINSTGTPAINGLYACDPITISDISAEMLSVLANGVFTNGGASLTWPLANGTHVTFPSVPVFKAWATAIGGYVSACKQFGIGVTGAVLPSSTITIA